MVSYDHFIREIVDIRRWLHTTIYSYEVSAQFLSELMENGEDVSHHIAKAFDEVGCNANSLIHRLSADNIKTCKELALIRSVSALEVFAIDSIREIFEINKAPFFSDSEVKYHINEMLSCSNIEELQTKFIAQCCRNLHSGGFEDICRYYKKTFDIDFQKFNTCINSQCYGLPYIQQHHQMRHLIVHRLGRTDEQYRKKYNTSDANIKLSENDLSTFFQTLLAFSRYINERMETYITTNPPENEIAIKVEIIDPSAMSLFKPTYAMNIKKSLQLPLSALFKSIQYESNSIFTMYLHGAFIYLRKYYKQLKKHESAGELRILSYEIISLIRPKQKVRQFEWADVQKVIELLPEKPWEKNIHKKIAQQLGWSNNKVNKIISNILIEKPSEIYIQPRRITLKINSDFTLTLHIPDALKGKIEWKSSNNDIATVTDGVISTISPGCVEISASVVNTTNYASCTVTVAEESAHIPKGS